MKYKVCFPSQSIENKFNKILIKITQVDIQNKVMKTIEDLGNIPYPFGKKVFKKLKPPLQFYQLVAQYRLRVGDYRILYDVDEEKKIVWILALRKRSEKTYKT